jgi:hypothetical protein
MENKLIPIDPIPEDMLKYLIEYTQKDIAFWRKREVSIYEQRAIKANMWLKNQLQNYQNKEQGKLF